MLHHHDQNPTLSFWLKRNIEWKSSRFRTDNLHFTLDLLKAKYSRQNVWISGMFQKLTKTLNYQIPNLFARKSLKMFNF